MNLQRRYDALGLKTYDDDDEAIRTFRTTNNNFAPDSSHDFALLGTENISRLFTPTGFGSTTYQRRNDERILYGDGDDTERDVESPSSLSLLLLKNHQNFTDTVKHRDFNHTMPLNLNWILDRYGANNSSQLYDEVFDNISTIKNETICSLETETIQYVTYGICIPIIASFGVLVNLASFIVLTRKSMRSSINMYLAGLSVFDGLLLLTSLILFPALNQCDLACNNIQSIWCQYTASTAQLTYPLINIAQTGSIWTLTAITVDRFVAIRWPLKSRDLLTVRRALVVLTVIAIWSLVYNVPIFFELESKSDGSLGLSALRNLPYYVLVYKGYFYLFFMFLIPAVLMIVLNVIVTLAVRRAYRVRRQLSGRDEKERRCTLMAVLVVSTFLVLNLLTNITNCIEAFSPQYAYKSFVHIGNLLVTVNSATNFFIYCALSLRFRQMFCKLFCPFCYTPEKEYQFLSAYFGSGRPNTINAPVEHGGIISMRSLRRPLISSPCPGPQRQSQQSRQSNSSNNSVGNVIVGGNNSQSSRKPTMKVDFSQRNKNLVSRRPPAYD